MESLGERIAIIRKQKGLSQEALSERAGINLRTLQRIEKNETAPRGNTMQMLCSALNVPIEELVDYGKQDDRSFLIWFHLTPLAGLAFPLGQIILPLILWLSKRDQVKDIYEQGANLINFQIWWTIISFVTTVFTMLFQFSMTSIKMGMYFVILGMIIVNGIYPLITALRIYRGTPVKPFYPWLIRIIK